MKPDKIIYTAKTNVTGGRDGLAKSDDGNLEIKLSTPKELGGAGGNGTNPEQLFAAGYSACFIGALKVVSMRKKQSLPDGLSIDAEVGIGPAGDAFSIAVNLKVNLPGIENAEEIVAEAHQVCPYSNATRNNIDVTFEVTN